MPSMSELGNCTHRQFAHHCEKDDDEPQQRKKKGRKMHVPERMS